MTDTNPFADIVIPKINKYPATESVLLHGPPGTGKTTTAGARVNLLIRDHGYTINDVSWITYRRSLAEETLERLVAWGTVGPAELEDPANGPTRNIGTVHAVAKRSTGESRPVVDNGDRIRFCNDHLNGLRFKGYNRYTDGPGQQLFKFFEWMVDNRLDPGDPMQHDRYPHIQELWEACPGEIAGAWEAWVAYKEHIGKIDYNEMLTRALIERAFPPCKVLVVDEYHDVTPLMACVCEMWMDAADIVIVAGDNHQTINNYQGADPRFFDRLADRYPKILLDKSYRVPAEHWGPATTVLSHAHEPPAVTPRDGDRASLTTHKMTNSENFLQKDGEWYTPAAENRMSPVWITEQADTDVMFLARTKWQLDGICRSLEMSGVVYDAMQNVGCGWGQGDRTHDERILNLHNAMQKIRWVNPSDLPEVYTDADRNGERKGLAHFMQDGAGMNNDVDPQTVELTAGETVVLLEHTRGDHHSIPPREITKTCNETRGSKKSHTLGEFARYVEPSFWHEYNQGSSSVSRLTRGEWTEWDDPDRKLHALTNALKRNDSPVYMDDVGVSIKTIHAAKGGEATHVVLYDGITNKISRSLTENEADRRNECRVWYVGLTRARQHLTVIFNGFQGTDSYLPDNLRNYVRPAPTGEANV